MVKLSTFKLTHEKEDIDTGEIAIIAENEVYYISIVILLAAAVAIYSIFR